MTKKIKFNSILSKLQTVNQKVTKSITAFIETVSKPRLKVAIISYYFEAPTISGVGVHAKNLAKNLSKNGCEVHVFCRGSGGFAYKDEGVLVHPIEGILIPANDQYARKRLEYDFFESEVIKELIRENTKRNFGIVHTHGSLTKAAFIIKKICGTTWVHSFHAIEKMRVRKLSKEERQFEDLISWIESTVNHCDGAIFVSRSLMNDCKKHYTVRSKRIIPNGVDLTLFSYSPITKKNVLYIGRFSREKGVEYLPDIISQVMSAKDTTFTAVCPYNILGNDLKKIRKAIQKQQEAFKDRIKIIETTQQPETIRDLYRDCQIYIQPSKYESFGLCIIEAMATGRPVISFNVGGVPEVIDNAGIIVNDKDELLSTIKELIEDKQRCILIGKMAREQANKFDWDLIAKRTIRYYDEVVK